MASSSRVKGKDIAIVVGQATSVELLALAVGTDEQGNEQADAATVHVLEVREVEDDGASLVAAGLVVGGGQRLIGRTGDRAADVDHADGRTDVADDGRDGRFRHVGSSPSQWLLI